MLSIVLFLLMSICFVGLCLTLRPLWTKPPRLLSGSSRALVLVFGLSFFLLSIALAVTD
jgi:hypothetical protein